MPFYISYKTSRDALGRSEMSFTVRIFGSLLVPSLSFTVIYYHLPSFAVIYRHSRHIPGEPQGAPGGV